jgi:hypothetical protein
MRAYDAFRAAIGRRDAPQAWPSLRLVKFARACLRAARAAVETADVTLAWTPWTDHSGTWGRPQSGSWADLVTWIASTSRVPVEGELEIPAWSPGRFEGGLGDEEAPQALTMLVLRTDDRCDWDSTLAALDEAGIAYLAYGTAGPDGDGCRPWQLVLPLARPFEKAALPAWGRAYTTARIILGALGNCWFDESMGDAGRVWPTVPTVGDATPREIRVATGKAFDLGAMHVLVGDLFGQDAKSSRLDLPVVQVAKSEQGRWTRSAMDALLAADGDGEVLAVNWCLVHSDMQHPVPSSILDLHAHLVRRLAAPELALYRTKLQELEGRHVRAA